jgi:MFS transporter, DHA3 family, tetracycline resistance protein
MAESTLPPAQAPPEAGAQPAREGPPAREGRPARGWLLRRRAFGLLVLGQTTSTFGDFLFIVAFPFLVLSGRSGVAGLGLALTLLGVARLVGTPLGGVLADRWHPRFTMIGADIARACVLLWLAATFAAGSPSLPQLCVVATALGLLEGLFLPAYRAITPTILPPADLARGNSVGEAFNVGAAIAGQLVAGAALTAFGAPTLLAIDIASFAVSALTLLALTGRTAGKPVPQPAPEPVPEPAGSAGTFRTFLLSSRLLMVILLMTAMVSITAAGLFAVGLPVMAKQRFAAPAEVYGVLLFGIAVGRLAGSLAAGTLATARWRGYKTLVLLAVHGALLVALPSLHSLGLLLPALALLGFADGTLLVIVLTVVQQLAPGEIRGRVMAAMTFVQTGSFPISVALAGLAISQWGVNRTFLVGGVGVLLMALLGAGQRVVRDA